MATDGGLQCWHSSVNELKIHRKREKHLSFSNGFGYGNYKDNKLETLCSKLGNAYYIDSINEAKSLVEVGGTLL